MQRLSLYLSSPCDVRCLCFSLHALQFCTNKIVKNEHISKKTAVKKFDVNILVIREIRQIQKKCIINNDLVEHIMIRKNKTENPSVQYDGKNFVLRNP